MLQPMFFMTLQKATLLMSILAVAWRNRLDSVSDYYTKDKSQVITIAAATVAVSVVALLLLLAFQSFLYFIPYNLSSTRCLTKYYFSSILTVPFKLWHCSHYQHLGYCSNYAYLFIYFSLFLLFWSYIRQQCFTRENCNHHCTFDLRVTSCDCFSLLVLSVLKHTKTTSTRSVLLDFCKIIRSFTSSTGQKSQLLMLFQVLV